MKHFPAEFLHLLAAIYSMSGSKSCLTKAVQDLQARLATGLTNLIGIKLLALISISQV